jgi:hypothetical protein
MRFAFCLIALVAGLMFVAGYVYQVNHPDAECFSAHCNGER